MEYRKSFLNKIKSLFSYLMKIFKNRSILPKKYPDDYIINSSDQKLVIIIIFDKNIFFANDGC